MTGSRSVMTGVSCHCEERSDEAIRPPTMRSEEQAASFPDQEIPQLQGAFKSIVRVGAHEIAYHRRGL